MASASVTSTPETVTDERIVSPMTDSTLNHVSIDYGDHVGTVSKLFKSVEDSEIFDEALTLFERVTLDRDARYDENAMHHAAVGVLSEAANSLVAAVIHYHYAHVLFDILAALDAAQKAAAEQGGL
jgi:hypothetical protein